MDKKARKEWVGELRSEGRSLREIGKKVEMSYEWVRRVCKEVSWTNKISQLLIGRIKALGGFEEEWVQLVSTKRRRGAYLTNYALQCLGIKKEDFHQLGVTGTKAKAKRNFRKGILEVGLEQGDRTRTLINAYKIIQKVKYPPITPDNCNALLRVMGGFVTTREVDYGLNGPA